MSRVAYVDGQYLPHRSAAVQIEDRGYQFNDGIYEALPVVRIDGAPVGPGRPGPLTCRFRDSYLAHTAVAA
jgi:branched-subunit amino acid aminotransferase/4-amino-4-deoxychorismate lyase